MIKLVKIYNKYDIHVDDTEKRGQAVIEQGGTQKAEIQIIEQLLKNNKVDLFLDVGANYGEFSIVPASAGVKTIAFEPGSRAFASLEQTAKLYPSLSAHPFIVSDQNQDESSIYESLGSTGATSIYSIVPSTEKFHVEGKVNTLRRRQVSLDTFCSTVDNLIIKVDVEGAEDLVIRGAKKLIKAASKVAILAEWNTGIMSLIKGNPSQWWSDVVFLDKVYKMDKMGMSQIDPINPYYKSCNLLILKGFEL